MELEKRQVAIEVLKEAKPYELVEILKEGLLDREEIPNHFDVQDLREHESVLVQVYLLLRMCI